MKNSNWIVNAFKNAANEIDGYSHEQFEKEMRELPGDVAALTLEAGFWDLQQPIEEFDLNYSCSNSTSRFEIKNPNEALQVFCVRQTCSNRKAA